MTKSSMLRTEARTAKKIQEEEIKENPNESTEVRSSKGGETEEEEERGVGYPEEISIGKTPTNKPEAQSTWSMRALYKFQDVLVNHGKYKWWSLHFVRAPENNSAYSSISLLLMLTDTHVVNTNQTDTKQLKLVPSQQTTALSLDDQNLQCAAEEPYSTTKAT
ncbi:hypothetical protein T10_5866 [Trichinella papuae]|uniref:Uncharacterized protein n=1 Tax=Trichinella papuae TaxID=268474 RepID=A0A0V1NA14_9BILA|nr:hypothetical protein T10_5866 [Trichinella papuae]